MIAEYACVGLIRARDVLLAEQRELSKQKPRGKTDEALVSEISRLESDCQLSLLPKMILYLCICFSISQIAIESLYLVWQRACKLRITGVKMN
jgi:hypothetical protein